MLIIGKFVFLVLIYKIIDFAVYKYPLIHYLNKKILVFKNV